ncbi:hypothetical protein MED222_05790 [Vibrio sp. MED222]|nr:hypothetical protein MED222_05790 [Vibrio sp. MED222]
MFLSHFILHEALQAVQNRVCRLYLYLESPLTILVNVRNSR